MTSESTIMTMNLYIWITAAAATFLLIIVTATVVIISTTCIICKKKCKAPLNIYKGTYLTLTCSIIIIILSYSCENQPK